MPIIFVSSNKVSHFTQQEIHLLKKSEFHGAETTKLTMVKLFTLKHDKCRLPSLIERADTYIYMS